MRCDYRDLGQVGIVPKVPSCAGDRGAVDLRLPTTLVATNAVSAEGSNQLRKRKLIMSAKRFNRWRSSNTLLQCDYCEEYVESNRLGRVEGEKLLLACPKCFKREMDKINARELERKNG